MRAAALLARNSAASVTASPTRGWLRTMVPPATRLPPTGATLGVRVNSVLQEGRTVLPRQYAPSVAPVGGSRVAGGTMVRSQPRVGDAVTDAALFLASSAAARITGQTLRIS